MAGVDAADELVGGSVATEDLLKRRADLPQRSAGAGGLHGGGQQVGFPAGGGGERPEGGSVFIGVTGLAGACDLGKLLGADPVAVHFQ